MRDALDREDMCLYREHINKLTITFSIFQSITEARHEREGERHRESAYTYHRKSKRSV